MTERTYRKYRHAAKYLASVIRIARKTLDDLEREFNEALETMEAEYQTTNKEEKHGS